jgi:2-phospho-L-lactate guanylyltransferase
MNAGIPLTSIRILLPAKAFDHAKSRLDVPAQERSLIARRLFVNTLDVALQCVRRQQVFVMTNDPQAMDAASRRRVLTLGDRPNDLNLSLQSALATLRARFPDDTVAVMVTDLPRLTAPVLTATLQEAASSRHPRHVIDQHGVGTTFVSIPPRRSLSMAFGPDSARRFSDAGSVPMSFPPPAIAHDLDVLSDLKALTPQQKENLCPSTPSP